MNGKTGEGPPAEAQASPWNSLEVTRLVVSGLTPVLVAFFGLYLTSTNAAREGKRIEREKARESRAAIETKKIEGQQAADRFRLQQYQATQDKELEAMRADAQRASEQRRADSQRLSDIRREEALRADSLARDEAVRRQSVDIARYGKLIEKRVELWDKLGPELTYLATHVRSARLRDIDVAKVRQTVGHVRELSLTYRTYFSDEFTGAVDEFISNTMEFVEFVENHQRIAVANDMDNPLRMSSSPYFESYDRLQTVLARDLAILKGPAP